MALTRLGLNQSINLATNVTGTLATGNGGTGATSFTAGITMADNWRLNSSASYSSGENFLTSNWEQNDTTGFTNLGTSLTQSSGVFSFPSTGIYLISYTFYATLENDEQGSRALISVTIDNSNFTNVSFGSFGIQRSSGNYEFTSMCHTLFDVTDTSNCKVKFGYDAMTGPASSIVNGSTNNNRTNFIAVRLGDT